MSHRHHIPIVGAVIVLIATLGSAPARATGPAARIPPAAASGPVAGASSADCANVNPTATTVAVTPAAATRVRSIDCLRPAGRGAPTAADAPAAEAAATIGCGLTDTVFERSRSCQREERRVSLVTLPDMRELGFLDYDVVHIIPGSENSAGGSDLRLFYLNNRVVQFDLFVVRVDVRS